MALSLTRETPTGFLAENAYHRVELPSVGLDKTTLTFRVRTYKSPGFPAFDDRVFEGSFDLNGPNIFVQAYEHLKTLEEFAGGVDV